MGEDRGNEADGSVGYHRARATADGKERRRSGEERRKTGRQAGAALGNEKHRRRRELTVIDGERERESDGERRRVRVKVAKAMREAEERAATVGGEIERVLP